jgi:hypothetical protein
VAKQKSPELRAWRRRLGVETTQPDSFRTWVRLGVWESRMGVFIYAALAFGIQLIVTAPASIVPVFDFTDCYAVPPVAQPCERIAYRTGTLTAVLNVWCGFLLLAIAIWLVWELWNAVAPKPIADEFLKLVDDSFARDWRRPGTWPWKRVVRAYGFALAGVAAAACIGLLISDVIASSRPARTPRVDTSERFRDSP